MMIIINMLPPIKYKVHPKMAQILQQKRKRKQILDHARSKQQVQRRVLKQERKEYLQENKMQIARKLTDIHQKKIIKHNFIRQQQKERPIRIALKRSQRLMQLIPQRRQLIQQLKQSYLQNLQTNDKQKQAKIQQIIEARLIKPQKQFILEQKVRDNNIIDTNQGTCVICLTSEAHLYMVNCRHLISCKDCEFILRMQKKCPLCRNFSDYADLKAIKRVRRSSIKK